MLWMIHALDAPGMRDARQDARPEHSARIRSALDSGAVRPLLYGPLTGDDALTPLGSLFLVTAPDRPAVERFVAEDPFTLKGVWATVTVTAFAESANSPAQITQ
jgi:hypothetical protein